MRALRTLAAACLAAGLLTACSSSGGSTDNKLAAGATQSAAGGNGASKLPPKEALLASAAVMQKAGSAKLKITSASGDGTGDYVWKDPSSLLITTKSDGDDVKLLFVGDAMYVGAPAGAKVGGKSWMKLDAKTAAAAPGGASAGGFATMTQLMNPAVQLAVAAPTAKLVGAEQVDGQATTHYRSDIPVDAMVAQMQLSPDLKAQALAQLKKKGSTATVEFWINAKGEVVQQASNEMSLDGSNGTAVYSALGTVQPTKAPADSELFSLTDLLK